MAINSPHGEKAVQRPSTAVDNDDVGENSGDVQSGTQHEAPFEDGNDAGTLSSLSSQENLPSGSSSPCQFSSPLPSPSQRPSSNPSPSRLESSPLPSSFLHPSLLSSSSSRQSPPPSLPSAYQQSTIAQLNELALQDSENNNVDENSNQGYDQYAEVAREYMPDQSVRPRVRPQQQPGRDMPDRVPVNYEYRRRRRSSSLSHRRNLSEDLACSPTTSASFSFDDDQDISLEYDRLPRLSSSRDRDEWSSPQPLPPRDDGSFLQSVRRILPLSLRGGGHGPQPLPESECIAQEAHDLLSDFTTEELHRNGLYRDGITRTESRFSLQRIHNPALSQIGQDLRRLADQFAQTEERRRVQRMAEAVNLECINMDNFFELCTELFRDGITRERIVALFTFVGDIAVYHVRRQGHQFLKILMRWSWQYFMDHICSWVQKAGGWGAALSRGANALYSTVIFAFCLIGTVAAGVYIIKTVKDW